MDDKKTVVIDNGSWKMRGGFAGEENPKVEFVNASEEDRNGRKIRKFPVEHCLVTSWQLMEQQWARVFKELGVTGEGHGVLMTETVFNPKANRKKTAEVMFEAFSASSLLCADQAVLSLAGAGKKSGMMLDIGHQVTHAVPIYELSVLKPSVLRLDVGGSDITDFLCRTLQGTDAFHATSAADRDIVRQIKERYCTVAPTADEREVLIQKRPDESQETPFKLPNGSILSLEALRMPRVHCPESLFCPSYLGMSAMGIHEILYSAIMRSDVDLRTTLYESVYLSGGVAETPGLVERIHHELVEMAPSKQKISVSVLPHSSWQGGSKWAALPSFEEQVVTKEEFKEYGPNVLDHKFF